LVFNLYIWVGWNNSQTAHISKAFAQSFEHTRAVVAPLVLIIVADKIGDGIPVFAFNRAKQIFRVTPYLPLRLPKPDEIEPYAKSDGQPAIKTVAKRNRHKRDLMPSRRARPFGMQNKWRWPIKRKGASYTIRAHSGDRVV
jgi:hypothetical protein